MRRKTRLDFEKEMGDKKMQSKAFGKGQRCMGGKHQAENLGMHISNRPYNKAVENSTHFLLI